MLSLGVVWGDHAHLVEVRVELPQNNLHRLQIWDEFVSLSILAAEENDLRTQLAEVVRDLAPALLVYQLDRWLGSLGFHDMREVR